MYKLKTHAQKKKQKKSPYTSVKDNFKKGNWERTNKLYTEVQLRNIEKRRDQQ